MLRPDKWISRAQSLSLARALERSRSLARSLARSPSHFLSFSLYHCLSLSFASYTTPAPPTHAVSGHCAPSSFAGREWQCIWLRSVRSHPRSAGADLRHQPQHIRRPPRAYVVCPAAVAKERLLHGRPLRRRDLLVSVMPTRAAPRRAPCLCRAPHSLQMSRWPLAVVLAIFAPADSATFPRSHAGRPILKLRQRQSTWGE